MDAFTAFDLSRLSGRAGRDRYPHSHCALPVAETRMRLTCGATREQTRPKGIAGPRSTGGMPDGHGVRGTIRRRIAARVRDLQRRPCPRPWRRPRQARLSSRPQTRRLPLSRRRSGAGSARDAESPGRYALATGAFAPHASLGRLRELQRSPRRRRSARASRRSRLRTASGSRWGWGGVRAEAEVMAGRELAEIRPPASATRGRWGSACVVGGAGGDAEVMPSCAWRVAIRRWAFPPVQEGEVS